MPGRPRRDAVTGGIFQNHLIGLLKKKLVIFKMNYGKWKLLLKHFAMMPNNGLKHGRQSRSLGYKVYSPRATFNRMNLRREESPPLSSGTRAWGSKNREKAWKINNKKYEKYLALTKTVSLRVFRGCFGAFRRLLSRSKDYAMVPNTPRSMDSTGVKCPLFDNFPMLISCFFVIFHHFPALWTWAECEDAFSTPE